MRKLTFLSSGLLALALLSRAQGAWAQTRLYLDLGWGAARTFAEEVYPGRRPNAPGFSSPLVVTNQFAFDRQGGARLRLQLTEQLGLATGYVFGALGWNYEVAVPPAASYQPAGPGWYAAAFSAPVHQFPLLLNRTIAGRALQSPDSLGLPRPNAFCLDLVLGGGPQRAANFGLDSRADGGIGGLDTLAVQPTPALRRPWGAFVQAGLTLRYARRGHERASLSLYFTQGLTDMIVVPVAYRYNRQSGATTLHVRGTGFYATLGLPLRLATLRPRPPVRTPRYSGVTW